MSSILTDVKHMLGIPEENTAFDSDVLVYINTAFGDLTQLGVGPAIGYQITGVDNQWEEFYTDPRLNAVKSYVFLKAKLLHNPPDMGFILTAMENQLNEMAFRLNVVADYG